MWSDSSNLGKTLKLEAAAAGMSVSEYLLSKRGKPEEAPTPAEVAARVRRRRLFDFAESPAVILRRERESRLSRLA